MISIKNKSKCYGCSACLNICPNNAISMFDDEYGFKYPQINKEKCTHCGLCEKICSTTISNENAKNKLKAYACINKNESIRLESSSGGIFTLIAEEIIRNNGIVFGAKFDDKFNVIHDYTTTVQELKQFRGSKYVQSNIDGKYKKAKEFLEKDIPVLFTGTPCQIEGLKKFLQKDYEKLYTQDIVCHGVPSPTVWEKYIKYIEKKENSSITKINFREKHKGWKNYNISVKFKNGKEIKEYGRQNIYIRTFLSDICLRESCYKCEFKKSDRISDITLADFWGVDQIIPEMNDNKGTSLVIVNSDKGRFIFDKIKLDIIYKEVDIDEAVKHNKSIVKSATENKNRQKFARDFNKMKIDRLINKYVNKKSLIKRLVNKIKKVIIHE